MAGGARTFLVPSIWDVFGAVLGIAGIAGITRISVTANLPATTIIVLLVSAIAIAISAALLRGWHFHSGFPLKAVDHVTRLELELDRTGSQPTVTGILDRATSYRSRDPKSGAYDRYQLVTDPPQIDADTHLRNQGHTWTIEVLEGMPWKRRWRKVNAAKLTGWVEHFRKMRLAWDGPLEGSKRVRVTEKMTLPNVFDEALEFYSIDVSEPARTRRVSIIFKNFKVDRVVVKLARGTHKKVIGHPLITDVAGQGCQIEYAVPKGLTPGAKVLFEWEWAGAARY